ncbi:lanthionine synthetase C family protein [Chryseolinea lacunae]|uniref:Lanthionine synthetase C family protein n=1 Tax=Chryseolinea lacunae TaxID=2801331 RepID=A0ABS1KPB2_9BACT|nr:lanthionine synthetase C family protein [Chryseolinea lacunae]MBL0741058.1 lanthionine synthetase C family protein [Chryseolinea lacunae]
MKNRVIKKILEIERCLGLYNEPTIGLLTGSMGISIFYAELYKLTGEERYFERCLSVASTAMDNLAEHSFSHDYSDGFIGIGCGINWLVKNQFLEITEHFFDEIDDEIFRGGVHDIDNGQYDFLHAAGGAVIYALSRLSNPKALVFINHFVEALCKIKQADQDGIKWEDLLSKQVLQSVTPVYNLGLAHGIPSIVMILLRIFHAGLHKEIIGALVPQSLNWVVRQRLKSGSTSVYPGRIVDPRQAQSSRLSWCYGDLGLATTFWAAGITLNDKSWQNEGVTLIRHSLQRVDPLDDASLDAAFCHGTAGIACFFRRFATTMQVADCDVRHDFWIDKTLKLGETSNGIAGYTFSTQTNEFGSKNIGLLEGLTGVGLVLMDHIQPSNTLDEFMLIGV